MNRFVRKKNTASILEVYDMQTFPSALLPMTINGATPHSQEEGCCNLEEPSWDVGI